MFFKILLPIFIGLFVSIVIMSCAIERVNKSAVIGKNEQFIYDKSSIKGSLLSMAISFFITISGFFMALHIAQSEEIKLKNDSTKQQVVATINLFKSLLGS